MTGFSLPMDCLKAVWIENLLFCGNIKKQIYLLGNNSEIISLSFEIQFKESEGRQDKHQNFGERISRDFMGDQSCV